MDFDFKAVEKKWRQKWQDDQIYRVTEDTTRPKYYVLDMFPYPSGAGLHVGHPLGYVASDIVSRYKRLKGYNVLHPMGFDAFGLPAEQYAIETGTPPQVTTDKAIATYKEQLGRIGFSYDWSREVKTCEPSYYKWTQWIFLQLFDSWYNRTNDKAENISTLIDRFAKEGCVSWAQHDHEDHAEFSADEWAAFSAEEQQRILMHYRIAYQSYSEVNWCEALGTVLANDEVKDGKSERGGYPVERRKMRQWFLRITEYSDRLLRGLDTLDWSEAMKDMQRNWIGRSEGALIKFHLTQTLSKGEGFNTSGNNTGKPGFHTTDSLTWNANIDKAKEHRSDPTEAEEIVWQRLRADGIGYKIRRQHLIGSYIPDFVCIKKGLVIEIDGAIHDTQKEADEERTKELRTYGFEVIRFRNEAVIADIDTVIKAIKAKLDSLPDKPYSTSAFSVGESPDLGLAPSPLERAGGEVVVFTTRPDTIFGATFMVIAPEHELVASLTTPEQQKEVDDYITYVKSRTDVERQQEKRVTGAFTGSYAINPFTNAPIPVYLAEYVLAGYGTGAIMAVPADDERDKKFAEKFGLPIIEVIDKSMYPGATIEDKVGKMVNSDFLNGMEVKDAIKAVLDKIETLGIGTRKVNYRQRDAGYSRQRYWGEPFPIVYRGDIPYPLPITDLPVELPHVTSYKPTGDGRSPMANNADWVNLPDGSTRETDTMPGYAGSSWYFLRYMDPNNDKAFASKEKIDYWQNVDLYLGGSEHAVGHLLYSRMWHKFLYDLGYVPTDEPFKKLINQGMIQGVSSFVYFGNIGLYAEEVFEKILNKHFDGISWRRHSGDNYTNIDYHLGNNIKIQIVASKASYLNSLKEDNEQRQFMKENGFSYILLLAEEILKNEDQVIDKITSLLQGEETEFCSEREYPTIRLIVSKSKISKYGITEANKSNILISCVEDNILNIDAYKKWRPEMSDAEFVLEDDGTFLCDSAVEKMSKSKYNVVNPDDVIVKHGADCFRMFEMFLGPLDQSKPWDDKGIDGVGKFIRRFWRLFYDEKGNWRVDGKSALAPSPSERAEGEVAVPTDAEYKVLHKTLKKIAEDIERLQFNTCVSQFMICLNELNDLKCTKRAILEPLLIALAPFAPFVTEELWAALGNAGSVHQATFPTIEEKYLVESAFTYPISINGKVRANLAFALDMSEADVKAAVIANEVVQKWLSGSEPKKFIFVKGRIINVVI